MRTTRKPRTYWPKTASELHRAWLELVETDGPFLAIPPLKRVWPQGSPNAPRSRSRGVAAAKVNRNSVCGIGGGCCCFPVKV